MYILFGNLLVTLIILDISDANSFKILHSSDKGSIRSLNILSGHFEETIEIVLPKLFQISSDIKWSKWR